MLVALLAPLSAAETAASRGIGAEALRVLQADEVPLDQPGVILHARYALAIVSAEGDAATQRRAVAAGLRQIHDAVLRQRYLSEAEALGDLWSRASALLPLRLDADAAVLPLADGLQGVAVEMDHIEPHITRLPDTLKTFLWQQDWQRMPLAAEATLRLSAPWDFSAQRRALAIIDPEAPPPGEHLPLLATLATLRLQQGRAALESYARASVAARAGLEAEQAVAVLSHYADLSGSWPLLADSMSLRPMHEHQQLTHGDTMSLMGLTPREVLDDASQWLAQAEQESQQEQPVRALLALRQALTQWPQLDAEQQLQALQCYAAIAEALALPRTQHRLLQRIEALQPQSSTP